jgi:hypothetical protein
VLSAADVQVFPYRVRNTDADELYEVAFEFIGREILLRERSSATVFNLRQLGSTIVVYDTPEQVKRARELLETLDVAAPKDAPQGGSVEYRPRFVSLGTAQTVAGAIVPIGIVEERNLVVLQGPAAANREALELLKRIDVPEKQVLLTCQLVEVGSSSQGPPLAKDLADNLQKLLPGNAFSQVGMALLKTSVAAGTPISIQIETTGKVYELYLMPIAFDEESSSLTIEGCRLIEQSERGPRELFSTSTLLRGNEYTVLAGTGATTRLLVLRFTVVG